MTREEAINILYGIKADNLNLDDAYTKDKYDALSMAIKALEAWEKVIEEIKDISIYVRTTSEEMVMPYINPHGVIHIIKKHLGEVEDDNK